MKHQQSKFFCFISSALLSLLLISSSYALSTVKLYESSVKVAAEKGENELIAEAFTNVLIKVSGRSDIPTLVSYQTMLEQARAAISQFRYDIKTIPVDDITIEKAQSDLKQPAAVQEKWFWVRFNARTIDRLLKQAQLPVWGKVRPETLIWFSQEIQGQRYLQSQHDAPEIYDIFKHQADNRGISLIFPFLDLQDQSSVSATDIWGNFNDAILLASRRYQAQSTVTARLFKERSGLWVSQWNLLMLGEVHSWELRGEKMESILTAGIDKVADRLAQQFSRVAGEGDDSGILIRVNNVSGFKAFQELDDYIRNLATVKSAALIHTSQDKVIYNITYLGDKNSLIQEIRLGDMLNSVERTRTNYGDQDNSGKDYQAVILGDLDKNVREKGVSNSQGAASAREKALNAMATEQTSAKMTAMPQEPQAPEKIVEKLTPELEYWLAL